MQLLFIIYIWNLFDNENHFFLIEVSKVTKQKTLQMLCSTCFSMCMQWPGSKNLPMDVSWKKDLSKK